VSGRLTVQNSSPVNATQVMAQRLVDSKGRKGGRHQSGATLAWLGARTLAVRLVAYSLDIDRSLSEGGPVNPVDFVAKNSAAKTETTV
jgi:hypothetical protein